MKNLGRLLAVGAVGFVSWKVIGGVMLPLFGMTMGLLATVIRVAVIVAVIYFVLSMFRGRRRDSDRDTGD